MIERATSLYALAKERYPAHVKVGRFLVSGGFATGVNLGLLYTLTDWFGLWYLASAIVAFVVAFFISFTLQKFWTFEDRSQDGIHFQAGLFFAAALFNLGLNTLGLYLLVEYAGVHYLIAQIALSMVIAVENFFVYQRLIFRAPSSV